MILPVFSVTLPITEDFENYNINAWDVYDADAQLTVVAAAAYLGTYGMRINGTATNSACIGDSDATGAGAGFYTSCYFKVVAYSKAAYGIMNLILAQSDESVGIAMISIEIYENQSLYLVANTQDEVGDYTLQIYKDTWYKLELTAAIGVNAHQIAIVTNTENSVEYTLMDLYEDNSEYGYIVEQFFYGKAGALASISSLDWYFDNINLGASESDFAPITLWDWFSDIFQHNFIFILGGLGIFMVFFGFYWFIHSSREKELKQIANGLIIFLVGLALTFGWVMA